jgi:protoporphyrinogen oxidase
VTKKSSSQRNRRAEKKVAKSNRNASKKTAIIIGAGPAGLTAACELLDKTDTKPIVFEASGDIGGISKTVNYKGNRIDIGGHRFFSKSDRVMQWWAKILPIEDTPTSKDFLMKYRGQEGTLKGGKGPNPDKTDDVMLVRSRLSRIYYGRKFYNYPVSLSKETISNLGAVKIFKIGLGYLKTKFYKEDESNLEGFYTNRFGRELYNTFFASYTEKLWGVPPKEIDSSWGAQRVKGLSITKVLLNALKPKKKQDLSQKDVETSLIESFLYPKLGPGHLWETVAKKIVGKGGEVHKNQIITKIHAQKDKIVAVDVLDTKTKKVTKISGDYFFSTMPVNELIGGFEGIKVPEKVKEIASGLPFRDFITVGILAKKLKIKNETTRKTKNNIVPDNWIYIQEPDVRVCRLQVFNNWSPYLVKDEKNTWVGMEYIVSEKDDIWKLKDKDMAQFGIDELAKIDILDPKDVIDTTVIHLKKVYPAYFGTFNKFDEVRKFVDQFDNLYLLGRNGQHHYNNQDHSMLTAIEAVDNIATGRKDKDNVWSVNAEKDYHESK